MKRRWRIGIVLAAVVAAIVVVPVAYIEGGCRTTATTIPIGQRAPMVTPAERRPFARTFLTYPEWHIVYEADAFAQHLMRGEPPSSFAYGTQIASFWTSYCAVNRATRGSTAAGDAKIMIYTIGISYTVELAVKAAYERTIGRFFEWASGWHSADDRYAAAVQTRYGAFMHETPWYRFLFGEALAGLWRTSEPTFPMRHWERRLALSSEYGVKASYAWAIDRATGATLGRDDTTLRFVTTASPAAIRAIDARLIPVRTLAGGRLVVAAPRYQQFNALLDELTSARVPLLEIAGNDAIFVTLLLPASQPNPAGVLLSLPIERAGWRRVGVTVPVPRLTALLRKTRAAGGIVEHVYDY